MKTHWSIISLVWLCAGGGLASAHSMHQSAVLLDFRGNVVKAELQLPLDRLAIPLRKAVDQSNFAALRPELQSYVLAHVHPSFPDGRPIVVHLTSLSIESVEGAPYLVAHLDFVAPRSASVDRFTLGYDAITHEIVTHVVLVYLRSDSQAHTAAGDPLLIGIFRGEKRSMIIDRMRLL